LNTINARHLSVFLVAVRPKHVGAINGVDEKG
jgi:hypothetical protein